MKTYSHCHLENFYTFGLSLDKKNQLSYENSVRYIKLFTYFWNFLTKWKHSIVYMEMCSYSVLSVEGKGLWNICLFIYVFILT